jgi:hypothetical protein
MSKDVFNWNVRTEMADSKPKEQSMSLAYALKRRNEVKMARGGQVGELDPQKAKEFEKGATESGWQPKRWMENLKAAVTPEPAPKPQDDRKAVVYNYATGGMAGKPLMEVVLEKRQSMSDGGDPDNSEWLEEEDMHGPTRSEEMPDIEVESLEEAPTAISDSDEDSRKGLIKKMMADLRTKHFGR